jgi:hypothetical protein
MLRRLREEGSSVSKISSQKVRLISSLFFVEYEEQCKLVSSLCQASHTQRIMKFCTSAIFFYYLALTPATMGVNA